MFEEDGDDIDAEVDELPSEEMEKFPSDETSDERIARRTKELGFKPQGELHLNFLLPYVELLDDESNNFLKHIKQNLVRSICFREIKPGLVNTCDKLAQYIKYYGYKFSKDDHVRFIKTLFEVLKIDNLEACVVSKIVKLLTLLLVKRFHLTYGVDLTLDWKILNDVFKRFFLCSTERQLIMRVPDHLEHDIANLCISCSDYFGPDATQEILDEWRPLMSPLNEEMTNAMKLFEMFLPIITYEGSEGSTYRLWLDEFMNFWSFCFQKPSFSSSMMRLISRVAIENVGQIDWEPHLSKIFTLIQKNFDLPVKFMSVKARCIPIDSFSHPGAVWIVNTIHSKSTTMQRLVQMFKSLESYFHPANHGPQSSHLFGFISVLSIAFARRLNRERHTRKKWHDSSLDEAKLTDDEVTTFVKSLMPIILTCMYCKTNSGDVENTIGVLASLRPEIVLPPVLERFHASLLSTTEPMKLLATMVSVRSGSRYLAQPCRYFPEGPTHIIPVLIGALPSIDPNDPLKCVTFFSLVSLMFSYIDLKDCSRASEHYPDLTDDEKLVCSQTALFEDFVIQFLEKVYTNIKSFSFEDTRSDNSGSSRTNRIETLLEVGLTSAFSSIMKQASIELYEIALKSVSKFIHSNILEPKIAGKMAAGLVQCLVIARPDKALPVFFPRAYEKIQMCHIDDLKAERLDNEISYNIFILSECCNAPGKFLIPYADLILNVTPKILMTVTENFHIGVMRFLKLVIKSMTAVFIEESYISPDGRDKSLSEFLSIREWGKPVLSRSVNLKWIKPGEDELSFAQKFVDSVLQPILDDITRLEDSNSQMMTRDVLFRHLMVLDHVLNAVGFCFPYFSPDESDEIQFLKLENSKVDLRNVEFAVRSQQQKLKILGKNARLEISKVMFQLQKRLLAEKEDDTKTLICLGRIFEALLFSKSPELDGFSNFSSIVKHLHLYEKKTKHPFLGNRGFSRVSNIDRTKIYHFIRYNTLPLVPLTNAHVDVFKALFQLATSAYSNVRKCGQEILLRCIQDFQLSDEVILPWILEILCDESNKITHEQLKGALHIVTGNRHRSLLINKNWSYIEKLWPALLVFKHTEKPSITNLTESIRNLLYLNFRTSQLTEIVPNDCIDAIKSIWSYLPEIAPGQDEADEEEKSLISRNEKNIESYENLLKTICNLIETGRLHWRRHSLAAEMVNLLLRHDAKLPARCIPAVMNNLLHDDIHIRRLSILGIGRILSQHKRPYPKDELEAPKVTSEYPGIRQDNEWVCFDSKKLPMTAEAWNAMNFVHKPHIGYYRWPGVLKVPSKTNRPEEPAPENLSDSERIIYEFFSSDEKLDQLIGFMSLEEKKGFDRFNGDRYILYKAVFRNFGKLVLPVFQKQVEKLAKDKTEGSQRTIAEIFAGMVRGSKYWPFETVQYMWKWMTPLINDCLTQISVENVTDWGTCSATISQSRSSMQIHWLFTSLMEDPIRSQGAFVDSSRLYVLQGALQQQRWRVGELLRALLQILMGYLDHPYEDVRSRISSLLGTVFYSNLEFEGFPIEENDKSGPRITDFLKEVMEKIGSLLSDSDSFIEEKPQTLPLEKLEDQSSNVNDKGKGIQGLENDHLPNVIIDLRPTFWPYLNCELSKSNINSTLLSQWREAFEVSKDSLNRSELGHHVENYLKNSPEQTVSKENVVYLQLKRTDHPNIVDLPFNLGHGLVLPSDVAKRFGDPLHLIPFLIPKKSFREPSSWPQTDFPPPIQPQVPPNPNSRPPNFPIQHGAPVMLPFHTSPLEPIANLNPSGLKHSNGPKASLELPIDIPYREYLQNLLKSCGSPLPVVDERPWPNLILQEAFVKLEKDLDTSDEGLFLSFLRNFSSNVGGVIKLINKRKNLRSVFGLYPAFGVIPHPQEKDQYQIVVFITPRWDPHMNMGVACPIPLDCVLKLLSLQTSESHPLVSYLRSLIPLDVIAAVADLAATRRALEGPLTLVLQEDPVKDLFSNVETQSKENDEKRQRGLRLLETICKFITNFLGSSIYGIHPELFCFLPYLCIHMNNDLHPRLVEMCSHSLIVMSASVVRHPHIPGVLQKIQRVTKLKFWKGRRVALEVLQFFVFSNLPSFSAEQKWIDQIISIVLESLYDEITEVREKASQVLSGLLHCQVISPDQRDKLLETFKKEIRLSTRKKLKDAKLPASKLNEANRRKQSAILGLCALVDAHPYTIPEFLPDVLMVLSDCLHDGPVMAKPIKKSLQEFKRTHQDGWDEHKSKFSEDQLAVLTDLLVSPSYYA